MLSMNSLAPRVAAVAVPLMLMVAGALLLPAQSQVAPTEAKKAPVTRDLQSDTWVATDGLGRTLPDAVECGPPRKDKFVGIFYFQWMDHARHNKDGQLFDNTKILAANPTDPQYGTLHAFHWWGEPHMGYYQSNDEFVIRKHAQMLSDAGVDVIILDVTNAITYDDTYLTICRVYKDIRAHGGKTPQIAFLANSKSATVTQKLYDDFYAKNLFPELWFRWKGKPLLLTPPEGLSEQVKGFFTLRHSWAWTNNPKGWFGDGKDKWPWVDNFPQGYGWHENKDKPEEISVCVAQHPTGNIGRSFHDGKQPPPGHTKSEQGLCFAEQWRRALEVDPEFVFITGWNEWIAQRFVSGKGGGPGFLGRRLNEGETFFVDQYNREFSRDIEPMKGDFGDAYYYQMVANIRRYKGVRPRTKSSAPRTIPIGANFASWGKVVAGGTFLDSAGDTTHRIHPSWSDAVGMYTNTTGRNDFDTLKVAHDTKNLYFYARTTAAITAPGGDNWMMLLLNTDGDPKTGWNGYDFAVRHITTNGKTASLLCRNVEGKWEWQTVMPVKVARKGKEMHLAVPRAALGQADKKLRIDFKWADNIPNSGDILDFIDKGDVAPSGCFNYRYEE